MRPVFAVAAAGLGLIALMTACALIFLRAPGMLGRPSRLHPRADLAVSAQALFAAYCDGAATADRTYAGKVLDLSGQVATVGEDAGGPYIIYSVVRPHRGGPVSPEAVWARIAEAAASGVQGVRCYFPKGRKPDVKQGQDVTIRGRSAGMPLDVEVRDCEMAP
jgi:hypothetical protein